MQLAKEIIVGKHGDEYSWIPRTLIPSPLSQSLVPVS